MSTLDTVGSFSHNWNRKGGLYMDRYVTIKELISMKSKNFYNNFVKEFKPVKHPVLKIKLFKMDDVLRFSEHFMERRDFVSIKNICIMAGISREWFYQLLRRGVVPKPQMGTKRNMGYKEDEVTDVLNRISNISKK